MGFVRSPTQVNHGRLACLVGLVAFGVSSAGVTNPLTATTVTGNPFISSELSMEKVANVTEQMSQCLAQRVGTDAAQSADLNQLFTEAAGRRRLAATTKESFLVILQEAKMEDVLPATVFEAHGLNKFKPMGSAGCFVVTMTSDTAVELVKDPYVALAVPFTPGFKADPQAITTLEEAVSTAVNQTKGGTATAIDTTVGAIGDLTNTAVHNANDMMNALKNMAKGKLKKNITTTTIADGILDAVNTTTGVDLAAATAAAKKAVDPNEILSLHVTLADADNLDETLASWQAQMTALGMDPNLISLETSAVPTNAMSSSTRYVVAKVPAASGSALIKLLSDQPQVDWIENTPRITTLNKWAKGITQSGDWQIQPVTAAGLDGAGQVVGIADTGLDANSCYLNDPSVPTPYDTTSAYHRKLVTYIAFADRLENYDSSPNSADPIGHGTHVSGSVAGKSSGSMGAYNGMATAAKIAFFDIAKYDSSGSVMLYPPSDLNQGLFVQLYNAGARVMSMSWGSPDSNCYSSYAVMVDEFHWNRPDALIVFAAGNSGQNGDYSVVTPSTAKNCLTVGASYNMIQSTFQLENNLNYVAYFSSQGPTSDGRLKPDVLAPGYYITSAHNGDTCGVVMSRGTSMATPVVAGNVALVRQFFMSGRYRGQPLLPSGALLKAMMIHSAQPMSAYEDEQGTLHNVKCPDNHQGYGRIELDQILDIGSKNRFTMVAYGSANATDPRYRTFNKAGDVHQYKVAMVNTTSKPRALKATLVWTDRPSSASSCQHTTNSVLTNDLDLNIIGPDGKVYYPVSQNGLAADRSNNVEQVVITSPIPAANYTIVVRAHSLVTSQPYALVFTGQFIGNQYDETEADLDPPSSIWSSVNQLFDSSSPSVVLLVVVIILAVATITFFIRRRLRRKDDAAMSNIQAPNRRQGEGEGIAATLHEVDYGRRGQDQRRMQQRI